MRIQFKESLVYLLVILFSSIFIGSLKYNLKIEGARNRSNSPALKLNRNNQKRVEKQNINLQSIQETPQ